MGMTKGERNRQQEKGQQQQKKTGGGAGKKRAYRSRYYGSTYAEKKLKRILLSNGPKVAREWAGAHQKDRSAMWALDRLSKSEGPSEHSEATKIGRLATEAMQL